MASGKGIKGACGNEGGLTQMRFEKECLFIGALGFTEGGSRHLERGEGGVDYGLEGRWVLYCWSRSSSATWGEVRIV